MPVVDAHVHIYPEKISDRASESVGAFYGIGMYSGGAIAQLRAADEGTPVTHNVVYSVANKESQVESINTFIAGACTENPDLVGFMTMHQDYPDFEAEVERAVGLGLRGIKLHPDSQRVDLDDPKLLPLYEIAQEKSLPMVIHTGDYRYDFSHPRRMKRVLHMFPELVVNAAHFGGWSIFDYALELLEHERCFVDTSSAQHLLGPRRTRELCLAYGTKRVLWGTDFPMWSVKREYEQFASLGFTQEQFEDMTWHNAETFLGVEIR